MSAGNDIVWTSMIPGLKQLEDHDWEFSHATVEEAGAKHEAAHPAYHVSNGIVIFVVLVVLALLARKGLKTSNFTDEDLIPEDKITIKNVMEIAVSAISKLLDDVLGSEGPKYIHLVGSFALFILFCNLSGLIPGFLPPTENVNTTFALGLTVFFATHFYGFKVKGIGYAKHFLGPYMPIAPLMLPIEIISHLARPLSLGLRLFGNIMGDHKVGAIFFGLVAIGLPVVSLFLGVFVSVVQTFVFCLLAMIYLAGAVAHDH